MSETMGEALPPLKITCKSTDCKKDLHCFLPAPKSRKKPCDQIIFDFNSNEATVESQNETYTDHHQCYQCGVNLIDWRRIHQRNLADVDYTFKSLKYELFRHRYWHITIDETAVNHARRKGLTALHIAAERRVRQSVGKGVLLSEPNFDGRQTPLSANSIFYAQHATATCCRKCMVVWYKIPHDQDLSDEQVDYFVNLIMLYIRERLPFLKDEPEQIPPTI